jgi:predicted amidohydrolase YtcJ
MQWLPTRATIATRHHPCRLCQRRVVAGDGQIQVLVPLFSPRLFTSRGDDLFRDVGEELARQYKPAKTYLQRGIPMIASSDIPSTFHYNPFISLYSLVTRKTHKGTVIAPHEAIDRMAACARTPSHPHR